MERAPTPDPNDWRTWPRDGRRLFPPPVTTEAQILAGMCAFAAAKWGIDPNRPRKDRRSIIRVLKKVDDRYVQVNFGRVVNGRRVDVRVRGGCRLQPGRA
jgi:hypothetical protein